MDLRFVRTVEIKFRVKLHYTGEYRDFWISCLQVWKAHAYSWSQGRCGDGAANFSKPVWDTRNSHIGIPWSTKIARSKVLQVWKLIWPSDRKSMQTKILCAYIVLRALQITYSNACIQACVDRQLLHLFCLADESLPVNDAQVPHQPSIPSLQKFCSIKCQLPLWLAKKAQYRGQNFCHCFAYPLRNVGACTRLAQKFKRLSYKLLSFHLLCKSKFAV